MKKDPAYIIVLASGTGTRFGGKKPKQYFKIAGRMIIEYTLSACDVGIFKSIILVVAESYVNEMRNIVAAGKYRTPIIVIAGGKSRVESCKCGIEAIQEENARVVIHNGIQPLVTKENFERSLVALERYSAVTSVVPCVYTVLKIDEKHQVVEMPNRGDLVNDMGVEAFRLSLLKKLFANYSDEISTDIIGMVFRSGLAPVGVVQGDTRNIKITYPEDITVVRKIISSRKNG